MPTTPAPAFIHVDVDDFWAISECYGISVPAEEANLVTRDALPRLGKLFAELGIQATFFAVGKDLQVPEVANLYRTLCSEGHAIGNHSWSHPLNFRNLSEAELTTQVARTQALAESVLGRTPVGFRAPGYGASPLLWRVLAQQGFAYDSSLMPGPYGPVFRFMDGRLQKQAGGHRLKDKTQYPRLRDTLHPLHPFPVSGGTLLEIPVAASPLLRLPFQAGVCMRLGPKYFQAQLAAYRKRPDLPLLFLLHAADVADFGCATHPFFRKVGYFATPAADKVRRLTNYLQQIQEFRKVELTESWLSSRGS